MILRLHIQILIFQALDALRVVRKHISVQPTILGEILCVLL
jgi:hypothetical protein